MMIPIYLFKYQGNLWTPLAYVGKDNRSMGDEIHIIFILQKTIQAEICMGANILVLEKTLWPMHTLLLPINDNQHQLIIFRIIQVWSQGQERSVSLRRQQLGEQPFNLTV